jgi:hypothetical protein
MTSRPRYSCECRSSLNLADTDFSAGLLSENSVNLYLEPSAIQASGLFLNTASILFGNPVEVLTPRDCDNREIIFFDLRNEWDKQS